MPTQGWPERSVLGPGTNRGTGVKISKRKQLQLRKAQRAFALFEEVCEGMQAQTECLDSHKGHRHLVTGEQLKIVELHLEGTTNVVVCDISLFLPDLQQRDCCAGRGTESSQWQVNPIKEQQSSPSFEGGQEDTTASNSPWSLCFECQEGARGSAPKIHSESGGLPWGR